MRYLLPLALLLLAGCADAYPPPPPPPLIVERVPPPPAAYLVWIPGHWRWNGVRYVWRRGHYARRLG
jgi:hypothetical protein